MKPPNGKAAEKQESPTGYKFPRTEVAIVLTYLTLGALWIILSDRAVEEMTQIQPHPPHVQTIKGLNFVITTSGIFYLILRRNFSRRRAAEAVSRETTERFELVARATNDALWDWDLKTNAIWWSEGFSKLFGYSIEELEPTIESWTSRLHPDDRNATVAGIHAVIDGGGKVWSDEYRFLRKDGSFAFVTDRGFVIHDASGQAVRMVGGISDVTQRRQADEDLKQSRRQLRALSARQQSLREEERTRISREIHDELGQMLTGLKMDLRWVEKRLKQPGMPPALAPVVEKVNAALDLADDTIVTVQRIAAELRPGVLDNLGLATAIKYEAAQWEQRTGVRCAIRLPEASAEMPSDATTGVFRIFQETLTNIARHAHATEAEVELRVDEVEVVLNVRDNGKGISPDALRNPRSLGLLGMKERAKLLGGEITFARGATSGTVVTLRLPRNTGETNFWEMI
jgi:two-component system sensor histidine kinase UhpB